MFFLQEHVLDEGSRNAAALLPRAGEGLVGGTGPCQKGSQVPYRTIPYHRYNLYRYGRVGTLPKKWSKVSKSLIILGRYR